MKKFSIVAVAALLLTGCSATPVKRNFPDLPPALDNSL
jgi:uncharacterized protein YcfL